MLGTSARLLHLLSLLQARRFWSGAELAEQLEVTQRTIRRDVDRLRTLGYPVSSSAGIAGGYQLDAGARLPPVLLEDDEALAIALSLRTVAAGTVTGAEEAAVRALAKLERILPMRLRRRVRAMHNAVVPMYIASPQIDATLLTTLASAIRDHEQVRFRYSDRNAKSTHRRIEPHGLVHTGSRWYLVAFDLTRDDWRSFRVDRIQGRATARERFSPRDVPGGDITAYVSRSVGSRPYTFQARVLIHAPLEKVAAQVPPLAGHLTAVSKRRCLLESGSNSLRGLAWHIASLGEEFEVQSPPELAEHIAELAGRFSRAAARATHGR